jgi:hypothetical protein
MTRATGSEEFSPETCSAIAAKPEGLQEQEPKSSGVFGLGNEVVHILLTPHFFYLFCVME